MTPKNKGGSFAALLFCLITICLVTSCHAPTISTNEPQARWGGVAVYIDATDNALLMVNGAQQYIYAWVGKWNDDRHEYLKQWDHGLGCHSWQPGKCECQVGDKMRVMFVAQGDTAVYLDFNLDDAEPQVRWGGVAVYVDAIDNVALAVNRADQYAYVWVGKWEADRHEYVRRYDTGIGAYDQQAGECDCEVGDCMRVMVVAQGDTAYIDFVLDKYSKN